jgi:hypothetical protein
MFVSGGYHPYSIVDEDCFRKFVHGVTDFEIMSRRTCTRKLETKADRIQRKLMNALNNCEFVATTADIWKSYRK